MTASLRKHIAQHFTAAVAIQGGFRRHEESSPYVSRYDVAFTRTPKSGKSSSFIVLLFDHRGRSRFSVEIGWSSDRQFPRLPIRPSGEASMGRNEFAELNFLARLSTLWGEPDEWWEFETTTDLPQAIEVAMHRLKVLGFPYLAEKERAVEKDYG